MAWNEPGKGSRDPWSKPPSRPPSGGGGGGLDPWLQRLKALFGKLPNRPGGWTGLLLAVAVALLLVASHIRIDDGQTGVVLRLGHFQRMLGPGSHLRLPRPLETVVKVNVAEMRAESGSVQTLTRDRGLVDIQFTYQYQVADARQYLFAAVSPEGILRDAVDSQLRAMIGRRSLDQVLGEHGAEVDPGVRAAIQQVVDRTPVGLQLMALDIGSVQPPASVQEAYAGIRAARDEMQSARQQAQAYASKVQASAGIDAQRLLESAEADRSASIERARSEAAGFVALLPAYRQNPGLTRHSLWLQASGQVLAANAKVVDSSGQSVIHLSIGGHHPPSGPASAASAADAAPEVKEKQP